MIKQSPPWYFTLKLKGWSHGWVPELWEQLGIWSLICNGEALLHCENGARPHKSLLMSSAHWATSPAFNGKLNFMSTVIPSEKECLTTSIHTYTEEHADALEIEPHFAKPPSRVPSPTAMKQVGWGTWLQTTLSCCRWATPPAFNEELDFCWWWKTKVCHRNRKHV